MDGPIEAVTAILGRRPGGTGRTNRFGGEAAVSGRRNGAAAPSKAKKVLSMPPIPHLPTSRVMPRADCLSEPGSTRVCVAKSPSACQSHNWPPPPQEPQNLHVELSIWRARARNMSYDITVKREFESDEVIEDTSWALDNENTDGNAREHARSLVARYRHRDDRSKCFVAAARQFPALASRRPDRPIFKQTSTSDDPQGPSTLMEPTMSHVRKLCRKKKDGVEANLLPFLPTSRPGVFSRPLPDHEALPQPRNMENAMAKQNAACRPVIPNFTAAASQASPVETTTVEPTGTAHVASSVVDTGSSTMQRRQPQNLPTVGSPRLSPRGKLRENTTQSSQMDLPNVKYLLSEAPGSSSANCSNGDAIPVIKETKDSLAFQQNEIHRKEEERAVYEIVAMKAFKRFAQNGKIHRAMLPAALNKLGNKMPDEAIIDTVLGDFESQTLRFDDFLQFVVDYMARQRSSYYEAFEACDEDCSGVVELGELKALVKECGVQTMEYVLDDVFGEVDSNKSGSLDFDEFEHVMQLLRVREGFAKSEYDEFMELFHRFDAAKSGNMSIACVENAIDWLGFRCPSEQLHDILKKADADGSGFLDEIEWIRCMRSVRDTLIGQLKVRIAAGDVDGHSASTFEGLENLFRGLGYTPDRTALKESFVDAGLSEDDDGLDLNKIWRMLTVFRKSEELSKAEINVIDRCFERHDTEDSGEINVALVGKMLRSMGYVLSFTRQQELVLKVDIDGSGSVDPQEFKKMIRMIYQDDYALCKAVFNDGSLFSERNMTSSVPPSMRHIGRTFSLGQAKITLREIGCVDAEGNVAEILDEDLASVEVLDYFGFCRVVTRFRVRARETYLKSGGFKPSEVEQLRQNFASFDEDDSGELTGKEIVSLVEQEFPLIHNDPKLRPKLQQILQDADEDGSGSLDFGDFLRCMRLIRDVQEQFQIEKEVQAVTECMFSAPEVEEFRSLFDAAIVSPGDVEIGFDQVKDMLSYIVPMGEHNLREFRKHFEAQAGRQLGVDGSNELLDFPEFLWLMRHLLDVDFGNLTQRTSEMVTSVEKR
eukprot:TRINITY_DN62712_c0_g1_i1.p1 TRINITY_DN62712_c0_g1~~TRINITY_DN62712_c0_g1_i1.p1  ORF type:complete len:1050 (+),score=195.07 TRINITY_DN62712_c0_g1_i1:52-3201(+)